MRNITSLTNSEIKEIVSLKNAKERYAQKKFIAEGLRTISTLKNSALKLLTLYVIPEMLEAAYSVATTEHIVIVSTKVMQKISQTVSPSGMLAVFELPDNPSPQALTPGLVLAEISDPGNMGTLIRTAAALALKSIVVIGGVDPFSPKVVQSTAGTLGLVNIFTWDWHMLVENKGQLKLNALVVKDGNNTKTVDKNLALLIIGNEAHGINPDWIAACDNKVTIAMPGNTESLNAAIAGSIAAYQIFTS